MSDKEMKIREFFIEKTKDLEKVPTDMLAIFKNEDGSSHVVYPNDRIIRLGCFEGLKEALAAL